MQFEGIDIDLLMEFATMSMDIGQSVFDQLRDLLSGNFEDLNQNAVRLIRDTFGGKHPDIDGAIEDYIDWIND